MRGFSKTTMPTPRYSPAGSRARRRGCTTRAWTRPRAVHAASIWDGTMSRFERYERDRVLSAWVVSSGIRDGSLNAVVANPWWERGG